MTRPPEAHLTFDEFDALLSGAPHGDAAPHLEACGLCRRELEAQRAIVRQIEALPFFSPALDFSDRVLDDVIVPDPFALRQMATARRRIFASRRAMTLAATVVLAVAASMAASILWSLANPDLVASAATWASNQAGALAWDALRGAFANIVEQPWYGAVQSLLAGPVRLALLSACAMAAYVAGVVVLRRLMTVPAGGSGVAHA